MRFEPSGKLLIVGIVRQLCELRVCLFQESRVLLTGIELDIFTAVGDGALTGQVAGTYASSARCAKDPYCMNEDWSLLISGPILGTVGLSLTIPGISLMVSGYGFPRDAQPGRPDLRYVP